jgi:hypothetical protein
MTEEAKLLRAAVEASIQLAEVVKELPLSGPDQWDRRYSATEEADKAWAAFDSYIWSQRYAP